VEPAPGLDTDVVGSWCDLARLFPPASFDVVVFDPPHVNDAGAGIVGGASWATTYGTHADALRGASSIAPLFGPLLEAARAVLEPTTGVVLATIADQVHTGARQWQPFEFRLAALPSAGVPAAPARHYRLTRSPYDLRISRRLAPTN
jgi:hypothetical protein